MFPTLHNSLLGRDQGGLPVTALALSAHGPFGPARFARGLDKKCLLMMSSS